MVNVIVLIYLASLILAFKGLSGRRLQSMWWAAFIALNVWLWALAFLTVHEGYQADASGTAGSGSALPLGVGVGLITVAYNVVLFISRKTKRK